MSTAPCQRDRFTKFTGFCGAEVSSPSRLFLSRPIAFNIRCEGFVVPLRFGDFLGGDTYHHSTVGCLRGGREALLLRLQVLQDFRILILRTDDEVRDPFVIRH